MANYMALGDRASIESTRIYATICYWNFLNANKAKDAMNGVVYRGLPLAVRYLGSKSEITASDVLIGHSSYDRSPRV